MSLIPVPFLLISRGTESLRRVHPHRSRHSGATLCIPHSGAARIPLDDYQACSGGQVVSAPYTQAVTVVSAESAPYNSLGRNRARTSLLVWHDAGLDRKSVV